MKVDGKHYRTVWMEGDSVFMINQNRLPFYFEIKECKTYLESCEAIENMTIRGAPALGVCAAYAMAQAIHENYLGKRSLEFDRYALERIKATRPTARDLFYAVERVYNASRSTTDSEKTAREEAEKYACEIVEMCRKIGENGMRLINSGDSIETHCNAGWLACPDWGTALSPIYSAKMNGKEVFVYVDETRPRGQGARLTAWELKNERIKHKIIPDGASGELMRRGKIQRVIVGADRIARNGDVANKIGTRNLAIVANYHSIPFYVAAPTSTFDLNCEGGEDIPIEERSEEEVLYQTGLNQRGGLEKVFVCNPGSSALNLAFDATPAKLITGLITERGICKANEEDILKLFPEKSLGQK